MHTKKLFDYSQPLVAAATIIVAGFVIVGIFAGYTAYKIKVADDTIVVTGSAKESVVSDHSRWTIHLETKTGVYDQQAGFDRLEKATTKIVVYLEEKGLKDIETPVASTYTNYTYPSYSEPVFTGYTVYRDIIVRSEDIALVSSLANDVTPLTGASYNVTTNSLELTYSKLDEMRVTLLSKAIADAKARAEAIAEEAGRSVGSLSAASSGVVQVLPQGGIDISDYGTYDTQSMNKDVMVTVRATFKLK